MLRHLELEDGRDFKRAQELLDRAWKKSGSEKQIADAMFLVARELKKASSNKSKRVQSEVTRDEFGIIRDIVGEVE